jgi:membrane fusion protein (multidrug efflux system)
MEPKVVSTTPRTDGDGQVRRTEPPTPRPPLYRRRGFVIAATVALVIVLAGGGWYWLYSRSRVSTDDAFIESRIIRIGSQVAGQVERLAVSDNQHVKEGDVLVQIDDRDYRAVAEQAQAAARAAAVAAQNAAQDAHRAEELFKRALIARQAYEGAVATAHTRAAEAEAARKREAEAWLKVSYTKIVAPEAGRVTNRTVEEGQYVQVGQSLMTVVPDDLWVVANFKETQLEKIRPGQPVEVRVDAYPGVVLRGHVDSIQAGTGARFSLLPPENATGNFVKVVQRVPVKIVFDAPLPAGVTLGPGMSVVPTVRVL